MEIPCSEDSVNAATAYCACKFPLVALCQVHAAKHTTDLLSFHFPLPLSAPKVVTSKTVYLQLNSWLSRLNGNYNLLRDKLQLFAHCEEQIEATFQELLDFVSETKTRLQHELSVRKAGFHAAIEKAISDTRIHALETYEPGDVLSHLLWYYQPWEIEQRQLFTFQANCIQENLPLAFQVALTFDPSLDSLSLEKHTPPVTDQIEELTKQLALKEEQVQSLSQQLQETKPEHERNQRELQVLKLKLQKTEDQLQQLQTDNDTLCLKHEAEVDSLMKCYEDHTNQLAEYFERLRQWVISTDPPTNFQEPDYSTPQSRAALAKYGPYSEQDDELILVKRAPVTDDTGVYIGQWNSRGQQHGYGKYLWTNGNIYEGLWRNGQRTGRGRFIWAKSGTIYVGDFVQNKREGCGTYCYADGDEYSGAWVNNTQHGVGSFKFGEASQWAGDRYIGEYRDGLKDGIGAYFEADGAMHVGYRRLDKKHGKGLQHWADGAMYFGDYEDDKVSGTGCHMSPDGDVYRGEWKQRKKNGQGQLIHPGVIEEGIWLDGVMHTKGCAQQ